LTFEVLIYEGVSYSRVYKATKTVIGRYFVIEEESKYHGEIVSDFRHVWFEQEGAGRDRAESQEKALACVKKLDDGRIELRLAVTRYVREVVDVHTVGYDRRSRAEIIREYKPENPDSYARQELIKQIDKLLMKEPVERQIVRPQRPEIPDEKN
jgi:hypothetical protein